MNIERNVPIPERRFPGRWADIAAEMMVGDSVVVDTGNHRNGIIRALNRRRLQAVSRKLNGQGYRVWAVPSRKKQGKPL